MNAKNKYHACKWLTIVSVIAFLIGITLFIPKITKAAQCGPQYLYETYCYPGLYQKYEGQWYTWHSHYDVWGVYVGMGQYMPTPKYDGFKSYWEPGWFASTTCPFSCTP